MSRESLANDIWRACDIMRRDDGTTGVIEYIEQLSWLLFLKAFEEIEDSYLETSLRRDYVRVISGPYRWSVWTGSKRKRIEEKLVERRQELSRATSAYERAQQNLTALTQGKAFNGKNSDRSIAKNLSSAEEIMIAKNSLQVLEQNREQARINLKETEDAFIKIISWIEDQISVLSNEDVIEQQVLRIIGQQFENKLVLEKEQLEVLRLSEKKKGEDISKKLINGINGSDLLGFVDSYLFPYLRSLNGTAEKQVMSSIFSELPGNRMRSAENLQAVINIIDRIDFHNQEDSQIISQIYEVLLSRLGSESGIAGEFYTPRNIIRFMIDIIDPKIGETVYDPFCGSAGFLVETFKHLALQENDLEDHEIIQRRSLYGQEKKTLPALLGIINLMLHGVLAPNIYRVNTLDKDIRYIMPDEQYDIILTNPPFGGMEGNQVQENFPIKGNATELLSLQYIISLLHINGRCGVILPHGFLSRTDDAFVKVKALLLERFNLYGIISLPAGVFANSSSTGIGPKTDILFFEGPGPTEEILYYEIYQVGYTLTKAQRTISETDLPRASELLKQYRWAQKKGEPFSLNQYSWIVSIKDIKEDNYNLTSRNPNHIEEDYSHQSPDVLINDLLIKHQRLGEILIEMQEWIAGNLSTEPEERVQ